LQLASPSQRTGETLSENAEPSGSARDIYQARSARTVLEIDLAAIRHNFSIISGLSTGAKVMAVVKGDAYGLGARAICRTLASCGAQAFAVDSVAEGIDLRAGGLSGPILVIDGDIPENSDLAIRYDLMPGIANEELLFAYDIAATRQATIQPVWLVANVGFNRSGYSDVERFMRFALRAQQCRNIKVKAVYAHLTNSNGDAQVTLEQIKAFQQTATTAKGIFGPELETSIFASHGLVRWAKSFSTDWVRPGILLYGEHAFIESLVELETATITGMLRPAVSLRSRITHLLEYNREEGVGYGQRYKTSVGQRLATVSIGFGSGYPCGSNNLHCLVRGQRAPVFGEPGMDALQLDVTNIPDVQLYDWTTLIGADGGQHISVHDLAQNAGITPYELMSRLRCQRLYLDAGEITS
jgi:alanine racemase